MVYRKTKRRALLAHYVGARNPLHAGHLKGKSDSAAQVARRCAWPHAGEAFGSSGGSCGVK